MSAQTSTRKRFLSPVERVSEVLFGLVMTLSITGTLSIVSGGREEIRTMILGVLGCNIAWGIIDAVLYLLGVIAERGRGVALYNRFKGARDEETARAALAEALPSGIVAALHPSDIDQISRRLRDYPDHPRGHGIGKDDLLGAVGVFLLVVLSCVPILLPFFFVTEPLVALRASNAVAVVMMFLGGYSLALYAGLPKVWTGLAMVVLGGAMVGLTIVLGG
jgi:hypothetical protein